MRFVVPTPRCCRRAIETRLVQVGFVGQDRETFFQVVCTQTAPTMRSLLNGLKDITPRWVVYARDGFANAPTIEVAACPFCRKVMPKIRVRATLPKRVSIPNRLRCWTCAKSLTKCRCSPILSLFEPHREGMAEVEAATPTPS